MFCLKTSIEILNIERKSKQELVITFETERGQKVEENNNGIISSLETSEKIIKEGFYSEDKKGILSGSVIHLLSEEQLLLINQIIVDTDKEIKKFYEQASKGLEEIIIYMDNPILTISKSAYSSKYCYNYIMNMINYIILKNVKWFKADKSLDSQIMEEEGYFHYLTGDYKKFNDNGNVFIKLSLKELIVLLKKM